MVTQAVFHSIIVQANRANRPTLKEIAASVDLDVSTVKKLLKKVRDGVFDYGENLVFVRGKMGRRPVINRDNTQLVKELLT